MIQVAPKKPSKNHISESVIKQWKRENNWSNPCDKPKNEIVRVDTYAWTAQNLVSYKDRVNTHLTTNKYVVLVHIRDKQLSQGIRNYCIKQAEKGKLIKEKVKIDGFDVPVVAYRKP